MAVTFICGRDLCFPNVDYAFATRATFVADTRNVCETLPVRRAKMSPGLIIMVSQVCFSVRVWNNNTDAFKHLVLS